MCKGADKTHRKCNEEQWRIQILRSSLAERYNAAYCTLVLDLISRSGFATHIDASKGWGKPWISVSINGHHPNTKQDCRPPDSEIRFYSFIYHGNTSPCEQRTPFDPLLHPVHSPTYMHSTCNFHLYIPTESIYGIPSFLTPYNSHDHYPFRGSNGLPFRDLLPRRGNTFIPLLNLTLADCHRKWTPTAKNDNSKSGRGVRWNVRIYFSHAETRFASARACLLFSLHNCLHFCSKAETLSVQREYTKRLNVI
jgi:hypothetical protein